MQGGGGDGGLGVFEGEIARGDDGGEDEREVVGGV